MYIGFLNQRYWLVASLNQHEKLKNNTNSPARLGDWAVASPAGCHVWKDRRWSQLCWLRRWSRRESWDVFFCSWFHGEGWRKGVFFFFNWWPGNIFFVLYIDVSMCFFLVWIWYVIICIFQCIYTRDQCMIFFWFVEYIELLSRLQETLGKLRGGTPWKKASPLS